MGFFRKAVLMMKLPKRHATSLYGQPVCTHMPRGYPLGTPQVPLDYPRVLLKPPLGTPWYTLVHLNTSPVPM
jgi:hypothetical protein